MQGAHQTKTSRTIRRFRGLKYPLVAEGVAVGAAAGAVSVGYRWLLGQADVLRTAALRFAQGNGLRMVLWFGALTVMALVVALLLRLEPKAGGSGIPQVEGELQGSVRQHSRRVIWTKITGGFLCLVGGLSLGREGPSIQLGAMAGKGVSRALGRMRVEERFLITCGASAGLSAAFNAPLAGVMFALEEVHKSFSPLILLSAMAASLTADCLARLAFGGEAVFHFTVTQTLPLPLYPLILLLGVLAGAFGAFYNAVLLQTQKLYDRVPGGDFVHVLLPFLVAGVLGFTCPAVLGSGHGMVELLQTGLATHIILALLVLKFAFSMVSFGSGAPGGIFFPLLVLGAYLGGAYGQTALALLGLDAALTVNFVMLAMAAVFAGIVRAPITGILLITEMTGSFQSLLSLSLVTIAAYLTAEGLKSAPIYESLLARLLAKNGKATDADGTEKLVFEKTIERGAPAAGMRVREMYLPADSLLIGVRGEDGAERIPRGDTRLHAGDILVVLAEEAQGAQTQRMLHALTTFVAHKENEKQERQP